MSHHRLWEENQVDKSHPKRYQSLSFFSRVRGVSHPVLHLSAKSGFPDEGIPVQRVPLHCNSWEEASQRNSTNKDEGKTKLWRWPAGTGLIIRNLGSAELKPKLLSVDAGTDIWISGVQTWHLYFLLLSLVDKVVKVGGAIGASEDLQLMRDGILCKIWHRYTNSKNQPLKQ